MRNGIALAPAKFEEQTYSSLVRFQTTGKQSNSFDISLAYAPIRGDFLGAGFLVARNGLLNG